MKNAHGLIVHSDFLLCCVLAKEMVDVVRTSCQCTSQATVLKPSPSTCCAQEMTLSVIGEADCD